MRIEPALEAFESPFLALNEEVVLYVNNYRAVWEQGTDLEGDERHLRVLLDQCRTVEQRIHNRASRTSTSLSLTFRLARLRQHLARLEDVLTLLSNLLHPQGHIEARPQAVKLFKCFVQAQCRKNMLSDYWTQCLSLLSLRITENAGRTGEHYITETRREYFGLFASAAGAGFIIAILAAIKLWIGLFHLPPLIQAWLICLNYGLGFVFIHMLHFTVATKQPAMTANTLAASISETKAGEKSDPAGLIALSARTVRSQIAAILGNVCIAAPFAYLCGHLFSYGFGDSFITQSKAEKLLTEINPWHTGSLFYAALAGICLFLSGLIAGYVDNLFAYNKIPERLRVWPLAKRWFSEKRIDHFANYISQNAGALASNFLFGVMLGSVSAFDKLLGIPVDIRHIAFSSANLGYGLQTLEGPISTSLLWPALLGIALIGLVNLIVSFYLALNVAMRARGLPFKQHRLLLKAVFKAFIAQPRLFLLPPKPQNDVDESST